MNTFTFVCRCCIVLAYDDSGHECALGRVGHLDPRCCIFKIDSFFLPFWNTRWGILHLEKEEEIAGGDQVVQHHYAEYGR